MKRVPPKLRRNALSQRCLRYRNLRNKVTLLLDVFTMTASWFDSAESRIARRQVNRMKSSLDLIRMRTLL
ncbi:hypothetical protein Poly51_45400 [Rubripirellula tenax]|uniref:Uncharacterized protein n=1 Tax=Rubripirellula tenax TaxID=2528015 RepID=A0A5C6EMV4_9BACT|nr:hypothetical protein Poly51_45400 [Rubripirellula tenax]